MNLSNVINACEACHEVLQTLGDAIRDDYFQALLAKSSQTLKNYQRELLIYEPLSCKTGLYELVEIDNTKEMLTLSKVCKLRLDALLEAYLDVLGYPCQPILHQQLRRQFLEFSDIRDMVLRVLKTLPPWVVLERDVVLGPTSMSGYYAVRA